MSTNLIPFTHEQFGQIRIIKDENTGEPWFVAKDVCGALDLSNVGQAVSYLDADEQTVITNDGLTRSRNNRVLLISSPGIYSLILRSRKPEAKAFKRWITHEVLPSIRKTGGYIVDRPDDTPEAIMARAVLVAQETIDRMAGKLKEVEAAKQRVETKLVEAAPKAALVDTTFAYRKSGLIKLTDFVRKFDKINTMRIKADLKRLKYFYKHSMNAPYRVYAQYKTLFVEKYNDFRGTNDIYVTAEGAALVTKLYREGKLTMRAGY